MSGMPINTGAAPVAAPAPVIVAVEPQSRGAALNADIAAMIAEMSPDEPVVDTSNNTVVAEEPTESEVAEAAATPEAKTLKASDNVDLHKLVEAIDTKNVAALVEALGPAAEDLLSSKSHATLRHQIKDAIAATKKANDAEKKADDVANRLAAKYSDPIAVRKSIETGDKDAVDKFIDYAEKTCGADWNTVMRWVSKGLGGRPERLAIKKQEAETAVVAKTAQESQALEQTRAWVAEGLKAKDPTLATEAPELVDLVIEEMRAGFHSGVTTTAKALPLVLKKLEAQHAKLSKILAKTGTKKKVESAPAPAARVGTRADATKTRRTTLDEDIAATKREMGLR